MAKQIRVIKCPQCGSVDCTIISKDHYKCSACSATFLLEDQDININVKGQEYKKGGNHRLKQMALISAFILLPVLGITIYSFFKIFSHKQEVVTDSNNYKNGRRYISNIIASKDGKTILIGTFDDYTSKEGYLILEDLSTQKVLSRQKVDRTKNEHMSYDMRTFKDGTTYIIEKSPIEKSFGALYSLDLKNIQFQDITKTFFSQHNELVDNIASLEFAIKSYGDAFEIKTNTGEKYYYYPVIDKVFTEKEFRQKYTPSDKYKVISYYTFLENRPERDKPSKLIKIESKYDGGKENIDFWPDKGYNNVTPDRVYFDGEILYSDEKEILISYKASLNAESPIVVQSLKIPTMDINWSLSLEPRISYRRSTKLVELKYAIKIDEGYMLLENSNLFKISKEGKLLDTIELNK